MDLEVEIPGYDVYRLDRHEKTGGGVCACVNTIINSLVFSKLYYCSSGWSNTFDSNISKLQGVQNFAARIVSGTRKFDHDHVTPALNAEKPRMNTN